MTFEEYKLAIAPAVEANQGWRLGQAAFNVLSIHRPDLSERIRGTALDPYHARDIPPEFYQWVEENWEPSLPPR